MNNLLKKYFLILIFITTNIFPKCNCNCCKKKNNIIRNKTNNTFSIIPKQKEKIKLEDDKKKNQHEEKLKKHGKERSQKLEKQKEEKEKLEREKLKKQKEEEEERKKKEEERKQKEKEEKRQKEEEERKQREEEEKIRKQIEKEEEERKKKLDEDERKRKEIEDYYFETTEKTNLDYKTKLDEFFLEKNKNNPFPNLKFIKNLGKGGIGTVDLYKNTATNELVAVKRINEDNKDNIEKKLLYQEFKILNSLGEHPNIVKVKGLFHEEKFYIIVQEYCQFGDLYNHIKTKGEDLKVEDAQYFFYQLINAIDYLHKHDIVHRDIKPDNILITDNNILKICDFDFAKRIKENEPLTAAVGTKGYFAPEISQKKYDGKKNDIWSCGVVLYNMLTNNSWPYDIKEYYKLTKNKFSWNTKLIKDKSKSALDLLSKIFIFNPEKRITIEGIKKHKFYKEGEKIFLKNITMNIFKK